MSVMVVDLVACTSLSSRHQPKSPPREKYRQSESRHHWSRHQFIEVATTVELCF